METTTLNIRGMTCNGCVASVTRVLTALGGVGGVEVSLAADLALYRARDKGRNRVELWDGPLAMATAGSDG